MSTPLYDELEAKWTGENYQRAICDRYWTVTQTATGQEWFEDDEGNEVFPEAPKREAFEELQELYKVEIIRHEPLPPKRKFKLFGRNQGTNGTL